MGLECARPGMGVFHTMFSDFSAFQDTGVLRPSATPEAAGRRNVGQFCALAEEVKSRQKQKASVRFTETPFISIPYHCFSSTRLNTNSCPPCFRVMPVTFPASSLNFTVTPGAPE